MIFLSQAEGHTPNHLNNDASRPNAPITDQICAPVQSTKAEDKSFGQRVQEFDTIVSAKNNEIARLKVVSSCIEHSLDCTLSLLLGKETIKASCSSTIDFCAFRNSGSFKKPYI
jgi:hypothetical protein